MALLRGRLFAGALFAGALFGASEIPEPPAPPSPPTQGGAGGGSKVNRPKWMTVPQMSRISRDRNTDPLVNAATIDDSDSRDILFIIALLESENLI